MFLRADLREERMRLCHGGHAQGLNPFASHASVDRDAQHFQPVLLGRVLGPDASWTNPWLILACMGMVLTFFVILYVPDLKDS